MARKRIIINEYGINIDLLSKTRKNIYNIVYITQLSHIKPNCFLV